MLKMKTFKPNCNLNTITDGRGAIFSFIPEQPIVEWTYQVIKEGKIRGNHCHPEFDEYILLVSGQGVEVERDMETGEEGFIYLAQGECIYIPRGTYHVFKAITDCSSVSFLTKRWDDCKSPILHAELGHGEGDHGNPKSAYHETRNRAVEHIK